MTDAADTRLALLRLIGQAGAPIPSKTLRTHTDVSHEDDKRLSNCLHKLKQDGLAVMDANRCYKLTAAGRQSLADNGVSPIATRKTTAPRNATSPRSKPDLTTNGVVESTLASLTEQAQVALDIYVSTVGDPDILGPLRRARDEAKLALETYRARRTA